MDIIENEISKLEKLSKLHFSTQERQKFINEFKQIKEFLDEVKTAKIEDEISYKDYVTLNNLREDKVEDSLDKLSALKNCKRKSNGMFEVPKVVDND